MLGFTRVGMDDLVQTAKDGRVEHLLRLAPVRAAIDAHLAHLRSELAARAIGPQLARLRDDFEQITAGEVARLLREVLPDLDEEPARPAVRLGSYPGAPAGAPAAGGAAGRRGTRRSGSHWTPFSRAPASAARPTRHAE